jgi:hypothetical protein
VNTGAPIAVCTTTLQKGLLLVNEKKPGKEKVIAKFIKGPALSQTDFGNPLEVGGTAYDLCIYDAFDNLAGSFHVDRAGDLCAGKDCWKKLGKLPPDGKGYKYKDKDLASDGALVLKMKGGSAGKSKVIFKAKNKAPNLNIPTGIAAALAAGVPAGSSAKVQFVANGLPGGSAAGMMAGTTCLQLDLADVKKNDGVTFKAKK